MIRYVNLNGRSIAKLHEQGQETGNRSGAESESERGVGQQGVIPINLFRFYGTFGFTFIIQSLNY